MKTTILTAALVAALAGGAVLAQQAASPEAAPGTSAPVPASREGRGPDGDVPNMGPLSVAAYDADADGLVTREEVEARKAARFAEADADGDGGLTAAELVALDDILRDEAHAARAAALIARMDDDADGRLQAAEIEDRTPQVQPIFDRLDADGDGALSQAELDAAPERGRGHGGFMDGPGEGRGGRHGG